MEAYNLCTLNNLKKNMTGEYRSQFIIEQNPANILFVRNSYNPGNCKMSDIVPFN